MRVLSIKGIPAIEVEENELGTPVMVAFHVKVPPHHNGVFQVNVHGDMDRNYIIAPHPQWGEKNPNVFQHEIAIVTEEEVDPFPLIAVMNLDHTKTLHIRKGEIIGFAKTESRSVTYIATTNEINIEEYVDVSPKNWIPKRKQKPLRGSKNTINRQDTQQVFAKHGANDVGKNEKLDYRWREEEKMTKAPWKESKNSEELLNRYNRTRQTDPCSVQDSKNKNNRSKCEERDSSDVTWNDINEVIESDFLIPPGNIYPNRKVQLWDV